MILFLTKNTKDYTNLSEVIVTDDEDLCRKHLQDLSFYGYDKEATGLNTILATELLDSIGNDETQVVVDKTTTNPSFLQELANKHTFHGANIKYDYCLSKTNGLVIPNVRDVMLADKRMGLGSGRDNDLKSIYERRTHKRFPTQKKTRIDFINWPKGKLFEEHHIVYSAYDVQVLPEIVKVQDELLKHLDMEYIVWIENQLIPILGDMELEGWTINETAWEQLIQDNIKEKAQLEISMDRVLEKLKPIYPILNCYNFKRTFATQGNLFSIGEDVGRKTFNYNSSQQVIKLFEAADLPIPTQNKKDKKVGKKVRKPSISEDALKEYLITIPKTPLKEFIDELLLYKKAEKKLNSFGRRFLVTEIKTKTGRKMGYKNPVTGKVHTIYRQVDTATARLASGNEDHGYFNSQQLPKNNKYRHCFTLSPQEIEEGWKICTMDLSGAEVIIAASLSGETKVALMKDIHSELATPAYRIILQYIINTYPYEQQIEQIKILLSNTKLKCTQEEAEYARDNPNTYTIDKTDTFRSEIRDDFKRVVYGLFYGGTATRISEVLNIPLKWGEMVEQSLKSELPILFKYLEDNAKLAKSTGVVKFNKRTNSRHIFSSYLNAARFQRQLSREESGQIERNAKNYPIQGTQADMIKEGMVMIAKWLADNPHIEFRWKMQVHDEIVFMFKDDDIITEISKILTNTCNKYLIEGIEMKEAHHIDFKWHK